MRQFHKIKIGNPAQQFARCFPDFLSMQQVAGILIRDTKTQRAELRRKPQVRKKLRNVACLGREGAGLRMFELVRRKKAIVFLHCGTAAGSVCNDSVKIVQLKCFQVLTREAARGIAKASVSGKRAATRLLLWHNHFAAVGREHADGGFVQPGKRDIRDAAREKRHSRAARSHGSERGAKTIEEKVAVNLRKKPVAFR